MADLAADRANPAERVSTPQTDSSSHSADGDVEKQSGVEVRRRQHAQVQPCVQTEVLLLVLTVATGMQDAVSFPDYHCFASNQTGNTIFLTLAVVLSPALHRRMFTTANIAVALALFLAAAALTGQLGHRLRLQRARRYLVACNVLQALLVFAAAALQFAGGATTSASAGLVVIGLLAAASGSQVVQSRALATTEISTAMATAAWVDLLIDPCLFHVHAHAPPAPDCRGRNRRLAFLLALVAGGFLGALLYRFAGSAPALLVSAIIKLLVGLAYLFVPVAKQQQQQQQQQS